MSLFIYNIGTRLYYLGIYLASFYSEKAQMWIDGRREVFHWLANYMVSAHGKKIWVHCASLGEFEQARPLIEKIRKEYPGHILILTFFSPSGYEARKNYDGVDFVCYLPIDKAYNARKFVRMVKPSLAIWVKYEYWYHFLNELHTRKVPVVLISSVFRPDQVFFRWYGGLHRKMLGFFTHIFVQNAASQQLLQTLNVESEICTDTRFDRVYNVRAGHEALEKVAIFKEDKKILIAGSTWREDADMLCELINNDPFDGLFKYIIAPHDVSRGNIDYLIKRIEKKKAVLSRIPIEKADMFDVMIVNSIGLLSGLYYYGDIAYVGGGFDAGVHNILEPAVHGMPVIFGPRYQKSEEAKALLAHPEWHVAHTVKTYDELVANIRSLLDNNEQNLHTASAQSKEYVLSNTGGTEKIYSYLTEKRLL
jgi:3-deoxy-D-manno-octulosonic-acid transferase